MNDLRLEWRNNLRTNLVLWPEVAPNITALIGQSGQPYDEEALLAAFPQGEGAAKAPNDPRAVRNTFEILALSGLAYRSEDNRFVLSDLGRCVFDFLASPAGEVRIANDANIDLLGSLLVRGLGIVAEYRAIWALMDAAGGYLTNEELNRAIPHLGRYGDVPEAARAVVESRAQNDPTIIGPRYYKEEDYGTAREGDQRKVMNVLFLLAGAGGLLIRMDNEQRAIRPWAKQQISKLLSSCGEMIHPSTDRGTVRRISSEAAAPFDFRTFL